MSIPDKIKETKDLLSFYDRAIYEQELNLERVVKGVFKSVRISNKALYALIKGDVKLLEAKKAELIETVEELERKNNEEMLSKVDSS